MGIRWKWYWQRWGGSLACQVKSPQTEAAVGGSQAASHLVTNPIYLNRTQNTMSISNDTSRRIESKSVTLSSSRLVEGSSVGNMLDWVNVNRRSGRHAGRRARYAGGTRTLPYLPYLIDSQNILAYVSYYKISRDVVIVVEYYYCTHHIIFCETSNDCYQSSTREDILINILGGIILSLFWLTGFRDWGKDRVT